MTQTTKYKQKETWFVYCLSKLLNYIMFKLILKLLKQTEILYKEKGDAQDDTFT